MWPKMLFELLPHLARLVPMADKFFASRSASERAQEAALTAMAEGVRGDLGQVTQAHSGLYRQLQEQSAQIAEVSESVLRARAATESVEARITKMEEAAVQAAGRMTLVLVALVVVVVLLVLIVWRVWAR
jgi:chromosome segregation ATPase